MAARSTYVIVFTQDSWRQFKEAGANTAGFPEGSGVRAEKLAPGDTLLCYLVNGGGWVAALRVAGRTYSATDPPIWAGGAFPIRIAVEMLVELPVQDAIPATELLDRLPRLWRANLKTPGGWAGYVRGTPRLWPDDEAQTVLEALQRKLASLGANPSPDNYSPGPG
jgi:hypothetical protein